MRPIENFATHPPLPKSSALAASSPRGLESGPCRHSQTEFLRCSGKRKHAFLGRHPEIRIIGNENIAVEIEIVTKLRELRRTADQDAGFDHATDHRLETRFARRAEGLKAGADAARFDQFNIDPM